jgi:hypothetical protein
MLASIVKGIAIDPTTYAPSIVAYESMHLDWVSSQPFFRNGFVEDNERYTVNGLPYDVPVSYAEGNRRILLDSARALPIALGHNATTRLFERLLIDRYPRHARLIHALGWVERVSFASYLSYCLSSRHFSQWRANDQMAARLGYN